jgi:hypothetical protein
MAPPFQYLVKTYQRVSLFPLQAEYFFKKMDMVGHQTKSMNAVAKLFVSFLKQMIKILLVLVFKEDILPGIPPEQDVVYGPRVEKAWFPCHGVS